MSIEYFPNYRLKNNDEFSLDFGATIGVSFGDDLEVLQNAECIKDEEDTVSSKVDGGRNSDNELTNNKDIDEIKAEPDIESEKEVLINRQNRNIWGPPGGWVCFAGRY